MASFHHRMLSCILCRSAEQLGQQAQEQGKHQPRQDVEELVKKPSIKLGKSADSNILLGKQPFMKRRPVEDTAAVPAQVSIWQLGCLSAQCSSWLCMLR
jgi:hypothetical protein